MKTMRRILSLLMVLTMAIGLSAPVFAEEVAVTGGTGSLTIKNTTIGETYTLWQIFDATVSTSGTNTNVIYKLRGFDALTPAEKTAAVDAFNNDDYAKDWFQANANGEVTAKVDASDKVLIGEDQLKSAEFKAWVKRFGVQKKVHVAGDNTVVFTQLPYGYYMVESTLRPNETTDPVVSVNSVTPNVEIIDKNQGPSWDNGENKPGKVIVEKYDATAVPAQTAADFTLWKLKNGTYTDQAPVTEGTGKNDDTYESINDKYRKVGINEANLNEKIEFDIGVNASNYYLENKIWRYVIQDTIADGMTYLTDPEMKVIVNGVAIPKNDGTAGKENGYTITWYKSLNTEKNPSLAPTGETTTNVAEAQAFRIEIPWTDLTQLCSEAEHLADPTKHDATCKTMPLHCDHLYANALEIHVNYFGKLDADKAAVVEYDEANLNKSDFDWYQENDSPDTKDPNHHNGEKQTETFTTELELLKWTGSITTPLEGAQFTLTREGESFPVYTFGMRFTKWLKDDAMTAEKADGKDYDAAGRTKDAYTYWLLNDKTYTTTDPNTEGIDKTLYQSLDDKYVYESFEEVMNNDSTAGTTVSAFVGTDGKVHFKGLGEGKYKIEETVVPAGYTKAADIEFTVSFDRSTKLFSTNNDKVTLNSTSNYLETNVENKSGNKLPSTGGIGTTLFYVLGGLLTVGAGVVLVTRRRMKDTND